jgi:hypothetical protein
MQLANFITIEVLIFDLHPCAECSDGWKFLNCEANSLRGCSEPTIAICRAPNSTFAFGHKQLGR